MPEIYIFVGWPKCPTLVSVCVVGKAILGTRWTEPVSSRPLASYMNTVLGTFHNTKNSTFEGEDWFTEINVSKILG